MTSALVTDKPLRPDLLGADISTPVVWILAAVLLAAWVAAHPLCRRWLSGGVLRAAGLTLRVLTGTVALWAFWQAVARHLVLATSWPLWGCAFLGALAVEFTVGLYALERRIVSAARGRWITGLRILAILAVLTILVQPVFSRLETRRIDRHVVVLMDESTSMHLADKNMSVEERLQLAGFLGIEGMGERPPLGAMIAEGERLLERCETEAEALRVPDQLDDDAVAEMIGRRKDALTEFQKSVDQWAETLRGHMEENKKEQKDLPQEIRRIRNEVRRLLTEQVRDSLREARERTDRGDARRARIALREAAQRFRRGLDQAGPYVSAVDESFYAGVPENVRAQITAAAARPRRELALEAMTRPVGAEPSVIEQLRKKYALHFVQFGRQTAEVPELSAPPTEDAVFRSRTDLAGALQKVRDGWAAESLAGVVLLSDARDNGRKSPDESARALGVQGSPLCTVLTGSASGARDAAVLALSHPQSIFLGDRLRVKADLKADGMRGETLTVQLLRDGKTVEEQKIPVAEDRMRTTVRFANQPEQKGIYSWQVKIAEGKDEQFPENNTWGFDCAVSDDRTNVLLIDDRPRWEFRYLRNLFDSRDKSVHLQYVLMHPDSVAGSGARPDIPASAGRKFGESEATRLPASAEEWRKFDVIILGDVAPGVLGEETWKILRDCVGSRGALLLMIAGPNYMPHSFANRTARELIPLNYEPSTETFFDAPEPASRLTLTAAGRGHPAFSQSESGVESARIWEQMPLLSWRHAHRGVKEGAEVLAWARPVVVDDYGNERKSGAAALTVSGDPAQQLQRQKELESQNALFVVSQVDLGKTAMLAFDQTWRFRYGVGDTWHHRFWGQILRWGAGENLAAGTASVRLGTDRLMYETGDAVRISARLVDSAARPVADAKVMASITREDGTPVLSQKLEWRPDSHGMYEATLTGLTDSGVYRVALSGPEVTRLLAADGAASVDQRFTISAEGNPVETGDVSVDPETAASLASLSGGIVTGLTDAARVLPLFGEGSREVEERRETTLWDNWMMLALAAGAVTAEWILRRRSGLV